MVVKNSYKNYVRQFDWPPLKRIKAFIQQVITIINNNNSIILSQNLGMCIDKNDNIYLSNSNQILKMTPDGNVSLFAGAPDGSSGSADGTGTNARFNSPRNIICDSNDNIYVCDSFNHTIRKITPNGLVSTYAGIAGISGFIDGGLNINKFYYPLGITIDTFNNLYVLESGNQKLRKIDTNQITSTINVTGIATYVSNSGQMIFSNNKIYFVTNNGSQTFSGIISIDLNIQPPTLSIISGSSPSYFDGTLSTSKFNTPNGGIAIDENGNIIVSDISNNRIRKIDTINNKVTTITGSTAGNNDGIFSSAKFSYPQRIIFDSKYNLYVTGWSPTTSLSKFLRKILFNR